jgi:hypothetical protein
MSRVFLAISFVLVFAVISPISMMGVDLATPAYAEEDEMFDEDMEEPMCPIDGASLTAGQKAEIDEVCGAEFAVCQERNEKLSRQCAFEQQSMDELCDILGEDPNFDPADCREDLACGEAEMLRNEDCQFDHETCECCMTMFFALGECQVGCESSCAGATGRDVGD